MSRKSDLNELKNSFGNKILTKNKKNIKIILVIKVIVGLELENIGPYTSKVNLDFRINKRDKMNMDSIYILPDGEMITKIIGIIAGNAYGKTTIIDSLESIGGFISNPSFKQKINSFVEKIAEDEMKKNFLEYIKLQLIPVNKISNSIGSIAVDLFIDTNDDYSGYYKYSIKYDDNYLEKGVLEEKLTFRKKYNAKNPKEIFCISNNIESEIGYKLAYKNNIINDLDEKSKKKFLEKIVYYENFYSKYINNSSTIDAENYIFDEEFIINMLPKEFDFLKKIVNLVDNQIIDIVLDDEDKKNKKIYFMYENYKLRYNHISSATKKICGIALSLYKACNDKGIFLIDELDNSLNKNVARFIVNLYQKNIAKKTSQIIFTTNSSEMFENFRRDQIFLIQKDDGVNKVIKYLDFFDSNKKTRKDWSFSKAYNENIIKNYPTEQTIDKLNKYLNNIL